jgi:hypothetical protein
VAGPKNAANREERRRAEKRRKEDRRRVEECCRTEERRREEERRKNPPSQKKRRENRWDSESALLPRIPSINYHIHYRTASYTSRSAYVGQYREDPFPSFRSPSNDVRRQDRRRSSEPSSQQQSRSRSLRKEICSTETQQKESQENTLYTNKKVGDVTISAEEMANYRRLQEMEEQLTQKLLMQK